jgi:hypothetical protein
MTDLPLESELDADGQIRMPASGEWAATATEVNIARIADAGQRIPLVDRVVLVAIIAALVSGLVWLIGWNECVLGEPVGRQRMPVGSPVGLGQSAEPPPELSAYDRSPDLCRFPAVGFAILNAPFCDRHANWAEQQADMYPSEREVAAYARHARWKANCWKLLLAAHRWEMKYDGSCSPCNWSWPQPEEALGELRVELGEDDWATGTMPPAGWTPIFK